MDVSVDHGYEFSEAASGFGPTEFAGALSNSLNANGTNAQKYFGKYGLLARCGCIAQDKFVIVCMQADWLERRNSKQHWSRQNGGNLRLVYGT